LYSGHRVRLQNIRSGVRIPPGWKDFGNLYITVLLSICIAIVCIWEK
jgi:hypothetical protein